MVCVLDRLALLKPTQNLLCRELPIIVDIQAFKQPGDILNILRLHLRGYESQDNFFESVTLTELLQHFDIHFLVNDRPLLLVDQPRMLQDLSRCYPLVGRHQASRYKVLGCCADVLGHDHIFLHYILHDILVPASLKWG